MKCFPKAVMTSNNGDVSRKPGHPQNLFSYSGLQGLC